MIHREGTEGSRQRSPRTAWWRCLRERVDRTRLIRADDYQLMARFIYVIAGRAGMCADHRENAPLEVMQVSFSFADRTLELGS